MKRDQRTGRLVAEDAVERFWAKVERRGDDECWPWQAFIDKAGYGRFAPARIMGYAHRFAYELLVGPIEPGLHIDHLCRNRACVNPAHMEPVTQRENILRGVAPSAIHARQTHCIHGHEFTPENTYARPMPNGRTARACRTCRAAYMRSYERLTPRRAAS